MSNGCSFKCDNETVTECGEDLIMIDKKLLIFFCGRSFVFLVEEDLEKRMHSRCCKVFILGK